MMPRTVREKQETGKRKSKAIKETEELGNKETTKESSVPNNFEQSSIFLIPNQAKLNALKITPAIY